MEEKQWIEQAAAGDAAAFEVLVLRYQTQVYSLALRMVGNEADAQDLAQEAFVRVWKSLPSFQFSAQFSTWLYRLTTNICIDFLRAQKKHRQISLTIAEEEQWDLEDPSPQPEDLVLAQDARETLTRAMDSLDPEERQILLLRSVNDCSYQQIGDIMGLREGTVKSRLSRAREQLRKKLSKSGNFFGSASSKTTKGG